MLVTALQIVTMLIVLGCLVWLAVRPSRPRGARRPSSGDSWSGDASYNIGDAGQHHGSHHSGSDHSGFSGDSGSTDGGGGSDGGGGDGGGGGGDGGGGSSD